MIKIREVEESDLNRIHEIEIEVYPTPWSFSFFNTMYILKEPIFFIAIEDEEIVGYCVGEVEKMGKQESPVQVGHILNVAVSKKHQHKGIGTILLDEMESRFKEREVEMAYLEVRESNSIAQKVYKKREYQYVRTSKGYYGDEDGYILMKTLTR